MHKLKSLFLLSTFFFAFDKKLPLSEPAHADVILVNITASRVLAVQLGTKG